MEPFLEKLQTAKRDVRLPGERKEAIRARLIQFMQADSAVREQVRTASIRTPLGVFRRMSVATAAILVVLLGAGTSFAAAAALPGELLYPVKVGVNERMGAAIQLTAKAKAAYETRLAERRLEEASVLAAEGTITAETRSETETRFQTHATEARKHIATVETDGDLRAAADLASSLEAALRVHGTVLGKIAEAHEESRGEVEPLETAIRTNLDGATKLREELEIRVRKTGESDTERQHELQLAAESRIRDGERTALKVRKQLLETDSSLNTDTRIQVGAELDAADKSLTRAREKLSTGAYADAFNLGNATIRSSHEADVLLSAGAKLNINLRHDNAEERGNGSVATSSAGTSTEPRREDDHRNGERDDDTRTTTTIAVTSTAPDGNARDEIDLDLRLGR